jgi:hypothetical protein
MSHAIMSSGRDGFSVCLHCGNECADEILPYFYSLVSCERSTGEAHSFIWHVSHVDDADHAEGLECSRCGLSSASEIFTPDCFVDN